MAANANTKPIYAMLSLYEVLYQEKYNSRPKYNKFREKWAMQDVVDSVGVDRTKELLIYYFKVTKPGHPLQWFFYNFDKLDEMLTATEQDKARRVKIMAATKKMVEEKLGEY